MRGVKQFIFGFSLSFCSVALYGQLIPHTPESKAPVFQKNVQIHLFKKAEALVYNAPTERMFAPVKKEILNDDNILVTAANINPAAFAEGMEDDEILSLGNDDIIPIEFSMPESGREQAEVLFINDEEKTALLPATELEPYDINLESNPKDSPWVVAKGSPNIKNKQLLEQINNSNNDGKLFSENVKEEPKDENGESVSYKVAERIKQSIIFPIPDEILNDENLTPTFVHTSATTRQVKKTKTTPAKEENSLEIIKPKQAELSNTVTPPTAALAKPAKTAEEDNNKENSKSFIDSISSWFADKTADAPAVQAPSAPVKRAAPAYSSPNPTQKNATARRNTEDLINLYESMQETKKEYNQRRIVPTELKLSFQPGRAEISGSTLNWLKNFSTAANDAHTYLQIRLDASASAELQKKRLNLLYTIFMNNGVDFNKVETVFSNTEPNAFIIRTITVN